MRALMAARVTAQSFWLAAELSVKNGTESRPYIGSSFAIAGNKIRPFALALGLPARRAQFLAV